MLSSDHQHLPYPPSNLQLMPQLLSFMIQQVAFQAVQV